MFLGLDCSTQSLSALLIDVESGAITHEESINFEQDLPEYSTTHGFVRGDEPDEFFSDPLMWLDALDMLFQRLVDADIDLSRVKAISGSAQQHATVYVKKSGQDAVRNLIPHYSLTEQLGPHLSRPVSPIWLDGSTTQECLDIAYAAGGNKRVCEHTGSAVIPRFSAAQIRKYARQFPERWRETKIIHLCSSYLSSVLSGHRAAIDFGDGAGMNLMNLELLQWDQDIANAVVPELIQKLPSLQHSSNIAGLISPYFIKKYGFSKKTKCINWSGDNPCSLVGMGAARPGKWVMSLGTSYTLFSAIEDPKSDPQGYGHVFGNPIDDYMALSCFKNGALACVAIKKQLGITWEEFNQIADTPPSLDDEPAIPFFDTEITPLHQATDQSQTTARGLLDGQFLNMLHHTRWIGKHPTEIYVTGGISRSPGVCQTIANVFQVPVYRLENSSSASLGAAMRAAYSCGHSLDELEAKFCTTSDKFIPQPGTAEIYQVQLEKFQQKLSKLSKLSKQENAES